MDNDDAIGRVLSSILGSQAGREFALIYLACGVILVALVVLTSAWRPLSRFDDDVPDAIADDLLGKGSSQAPGLQLRRGVATGKGSADDGTSLHVVAEP
jgi:hypothetical protein